MLIEGTVLRVDSKAVRGSADVVLCQGYVNCFGLLLQDRQEVDVMGEDDHLSLLGFRCQPLGDFPAAVIQLGDGVTEDNATATLSKLDFGHERCDFNRALLTLA